LEIKFGLVAAPPKANVGHFLKMLLREVLFYLERSFYFFSGKICSLYFRSSRERRPVEPAFFVDMYFPQVSL
jgi:hypothetical protein